MPAFMTKDCDVQKEITHVVPALACMSLGSYEIVISSPKYDGAGQALFANSFIELLIICSKCHKDTGNSADSVSQHKIEIHTEHNTTNPNQHSTILGLKNLFAKFLNWKQYTDWENSGYWDMFTRLCHHYYVPNYRAPTDILSENNAQYVLKAFRPFIVSKSVSTIEIWLYLRV